jgi:hypothetical protein
MLFLLSGADHRGVPSENVAERLERLFDQAVAAGQYGSHAQILKAAGLTTGWFSELKGRVRRKPAAGISGKTAAALATALGVSTSAVLGTEDERVPVGEADPYPDRFWAVQAARALQYPEAAIRVVLTEDPGRDPGRLYWFRRIEAESESLRPSASPSGERR